MTDNWLDEARTLIEEDRTRGPWRDEAKARRAWDLLARAVAAAETTAPSCHLEDLERRQRRTLDNCGPMPSAPVNERWVVCFRREEWETAADRAGFITGTCFHCLTPIFRRATEPLADNVKTVCRQCADERF